MSLLREVAGDALGVATGGVWKVLAILSLAALLVGGGIAGTGWWLAVGERKTAQSELAAARDRADQLQAALREQNRAIESLGKARELAEERGRAARQQALLSGQRYDAALAQATGARATTCEQAIPTVNQILEAVQ